MVCIFLCLSLLLFPACSPTENDSTGRSEQQTAGIDFVSVENAANEDEGNDAEDTAFSENSDRSDTKADDSELSGTAQCMEIWTGVSFDGLDRADTVEDVPEYEDEIYAVINNNEPEFTEEDLAVTESYESYSELDELGRCGVCVACISTDIMPTEERGSIGQIKPTGWHTVKYDGVDGMYLYNRCHLIAYELAAENANEENLITGTRYFNVEGMLPLENMVTDFIEETEYHVLYRVTPIFDGDNLVASGVQMEARSLEDDGEGICYNVYVYNIQPGIEIDYATGESRESDEDSSVSDTSGETVSALSEDSDNSEATTYVVNTNTKKFHKPGCSSVEDIAEYNRKDYTGSRDTLIEEGFEPCKRCNP